MDKYDRQAAEIVFKHFGAKADYSFAAIIDQALRESAAEAWDKASERMSTDECAYAQMKATEFAERAAALRSTTRGKT